MASLAFTVASILLLLTPCVCQDRGGVDPRLALPIIGKVLSTAHVSASISYWGHCEFQPHPDFPKLRAVTDISGPTLDVLRELFAVDSKMRVTQESGGTVRLIETDVPRDLLDVRIGHISFDASADADFPLNGPNSAMHLILSSPEVRSFKRIHNIGPFSEGWEAPGDSGSSKPRVSGNLYNVTVAQAMDYVLQRFPGFWIYENCQTTAGQRTVRFAFFETGLSQ
jgi:hypothetical protein